MLLLNSGPFGSNVRSLILKHSARSVAGRNFLSQKKISRKFSLRNLAHGSSVGIAFESYEEAFAHYVPVIIDNLKTLNTEKKVQDDPASGGF